MSKNKEVSVKHMRDWRSRERVGPIILRSSVRSWHLAVFFFQASFSSFVHLFSLDFIVYILSVRPYGVAVALRIPNPSTAVRFRLGSGFFLSF